MLETVLACFPSLLSIVVHFMLETIFLSFSCLVSLFGNVLDARSRIVLVYLVLRQVSGASDLDGEYTSNVDADGNLVYVSVSST